MLAIKFACYSPSLLFLGLHLALFMVRHKNSHVILSNRLKVMNRHFNRHLYYQQEFICW